MAITLPSDLEAGLVAMAAARGMSPDALLRAILTPYTQPLSSLKRHRTSGELNRSLDALAAMIPANAPLLSDEAISRESIYADCEDDSAAA